MALKLSRLHSFRSAGTQTPGGISHARDFFLWREQEKVGRAFRLWCRPDFCGREEGREERRVESMLDDNAVLVNGESESQGCPLEESWVLPECICLWTPTKLSHSQARPWQQIEKDSGRTITQLFSPQQESRAAGFDGCTHSQGDSQQKSFLGCSLTQKL